MYGGHCSRAVDMIVTVGEAVGPNEGVDFGTTVSGWILMVTAVNNWIIESKSKTATIAAQAAVRNDTMEFMVYIKLTCEF
jgi:hypothetical protein